MKIIQGDLVRMAANGDFNAIVHGCNCFCAMGAGIAKQIAYEFPEARRVDDMTRVGDERKLGNISIAVHDRSPLAHPLVIINAYTQYNYERGILQVNYKALRECFRKINALYQGCCSSIAYPKIGAGLAGGDWDEIAPIIDEELQFRNHVLVMRD